jgi:hypothetical protein
MSPGKLSLDEGVEKSTDMFRRVVLPTDAGVPIVGEAAGELTSRSTMLALPFSSVEILKERDRANVLVCGRGGVIAELSLGPSLELWSSSS